MPTRTSLMIGWSVLFGAAFVLFMLVLLLAWWQRRRVRPGDARPAERAEWAAHAAVVTERAAGAAARAAAARERVDATEAARARAWQALEQADQAYREADQAYREAERAYQERDLPAVADPGEQREQRDPGEQGPRAVASAALAAYRRGDLSQEQLLRVWRWGSGWDPAREQRERALRQARAAWWDAHLNYRAAAGAERTAAEQATVAEAEARALAEEATIASGMAG